MGDFLSYYWNWTKSGLNWLTFGIFDSESYPDRVSDEDHPFINWTRIIIILGIVVLGILFVIKPLINNFRK